MLRKIMNFIDRFFTLILMTPFILVAILMSSMRFGGLTDWYYPLPNEYEMSRANTKRITIELVEGETATKEVIPANIVAFWHDERYVCARTVDPEDTDSYRSGKGADEQYYLLNTTDGQVIGPIVDERVFQDEVNTELGFQKIDFIATAPKPEGAIYYSEK